MVIQLVSPKPFSINFMREIKNGPNANEEINVVNEHVLRGTKDLTVDDSSILITQWRHLVIKGKNGAKLKENLQTALLNAKKRPLVNNANSIEKECVISTNLVLKYWERVLIQIEVSMESDFLQRLFYDYKEPLKLILKIGLYNHNRTTEGKEQDLETIWCCGIVPSLNHEEKCIFKGHVDSSQFSKWNFVGALAYTAEMELFLDASVSEFYQGERLVSKQILIVSQQKMLPSDQESSAKSASSSVKKIVLSQNSQILKIARSENSRYYKAWKEKVPHLGLSLSAETTTALTNYIDYGTLDGPNQNPGIARELFLAAVDSKFYELEQELKELLLVKRSAWFHDFPLVDLLGSVNHHEDLNWRLLLLIFMHKNSMDKYVKCMFKTSSVILKNSQYVVK